jgi:excisionase family DNA binding protein
MTDTTATTTTKSDLLTITEAAELLRTPVGTLRYWRHLGTGPRSFRVGRGVRYWRHEVLAWLHQQSDRGR